MPRKSLEMIFGAPTWDEELQEVCEEISKRRPKAEENCLVKLKRKMACVCLFIESGFKDSKVTEIEYLIGNSQPIAYRY